MHKKVLAKLVLGLAFLNLGLIGSASAAWPDDKPIEIIVGFAPGGTTDVMTRTIAPFIAKHLGGNAQFLVVNRPGASGEISVTQTMRAKPDGYTIGIVNAPGYFFVPMMRKSSYETKNLALLGRVVSDPTVMVVRKDSKYQTLNAVISQLKADPGSVSVGHNGVGTNGHLAIVRLEKAAGIKFNSIPYNGSSQQKTALGGGHLDVAFLAASEVPNPDQEAVPSRILGQFTKNKVERIKTIPTTFELGFPVEMTAERGFAAPQGLPADIQNRLQKAIQAAINDPEFVKSAKNDGPFLSFMPGAEWAKQMENERRTYEEIARTLPKE
jgi:tripartite-type tricarboxylate transporter receptor subunit TctC